jgi:N-acetylglucosamine malate deacetylase 2
MKYGAAGARTVLVTATRGEQGKTGDPPVCSREELGACREEELREAAAIIGFDELHLLGYRDRELADAAPDDIRRALVSIIRRVRPSVVVSFDPNGFNVHPDHLAISRFTSDALAAAADPRWHPDTGASHLVSRLLWTPPFPPWEACRSGPIDTHAGADFVLDVSSWRDRRIAALRAHCSQHLSVEKYFFNQPDPTRVLDIETWRQAWGPTLQRRPSSDIFEDIPGFGH